MASAQEYFLTQLSEVTMARSTKDSSGEVKVISWNPKYINTSIEALQVASWIIIFAIAISTSVWLYGEFKNSALSLELVVSIATSGQLIRAAALFSAGIGIILMTQVVRAWLFLRCESLQLKAMVSALDAFRTGVEFESSKLNDEAYAAFSSAHLMNFYGERPLDELLKKRTGK